MFAKNFVRVGIALLPLFIILGCGESEEESSEAPKLSSFWNELEEGCATCHSPSGEASNGPDFSTQTSFVNSLVDKNFGNYPSWLVTSDCANSSAFIVSGDASSSTLLAALVAEDSSTLENSNGCVSSYNYHDSVSATISKNSALYNNLVAWIDAGAINN